MAAKDITRNFVGITVLFETSPYARTQKHRPLSNEARLAQHISDQLRQQELCLRELQELVGKKSIIGDDPSAQIAILTDVLKKELGVVERKIQNLQQKVTTKQGRHYQAHFAIVCQSLKSRCAKSVKAFHHALQQHTVAIRERSSRRSKFSHGGGSPMVHINAPLFSRKDASGVSGYQVISKKNGDILQQPLNELPRQSGAENEFQALSVSTLTKLGAASTLTPPVVGPGLRRRANLGASPFMQQRTTSLGSTARMQQQHYSSREEAQTRYNSAAQVESTIVEITGMYTRMASMVAEQGEIISRIDDDMDVAQTNVEAAHEELMKLFKMVHGNRFLILKIFLVLILVIFLFVVVF